MSTTTTPTQEEIDDLILSARFGELEEVKEFTDKFGWDALVAARDERGNSVLHMVCGNGHLDVLTALLPHLPASALAAVNDAGTPPLHWAVLNNHTVVVQALVDVPEEKGGGVQLLHQKSTAGRDAFQEALFAGEGKEEVAGWIEGYLWKAEGEGEVQEGAAEGDAEGEGEAEGDAEVDEPADLTHAVVAKDVEEIEGKTAKLEV